MCKIESRIKTEQNNNNNKTEFFHLCQSEHVLAIIRDGQFLDPDNI